MISKETNRHPEKMTNRMMLIML